MLLRQMRHRVMEILDYECDVTDGNNFILMYSQLL